MGHKVTLLCDVSFDRLQTIAAPVIDALVGDGPGIVNVQSRLRRRFEIGLVNGVVESLLL